MNTINIIFPYKVHGTWVFDDDAVNLNREPFVCGIGEIIDEVVKKAGIMEPDRGFQLTFSSIEFPNHGGVLKKGKPQNGGCYYTYGNMEGWLCPALFKYFATAPDTIYLRASSLGD